MHKLFISFSILIGLIVFIAPTWADAVAPGLLMSRILVGDSDSASDEFVELENNSDQPVNATGWCIMYTNAASSSKKTIGCLTAAATHTAVMVPPGGTALFVSTKLIAKLGLTTNQYTGSFTGGMADSGGHLYLIPNSSGDVTQAIDEVDWGLSVSVGGGESPAGDLIVRRSIDGKYQDTNDNNQDFSFAPADSMQYQATTYFQPDLCLNDDGIQTEVPPGDILDDQGNCSPPPVDVCLNIDGVQPAPPPGAAVDEAGNCLPDVCPNLDGVQSVLPDDREIDQTGACMLTTSAPPSSTSPDEGDQSDTPDGSTSPGADSAGGPTADGEKTPTISPATLVVNELLPNPAGNDTGNEFIELYNASDETVHLREYKLRIVGSSSTTTVALPDLPVAAHDYLALYNSVLNFTLVNTMGQVSLVKISDGSTVSQSDIYQSAADDMAWAQIDGLWQYTNQPTPNAANLPSLDEGVLLTVDIKACAANQYRNPETNRCRLLPVAPAPIACKTGQYRSEETGRCRAIAADTNSLTSCGAGQERNPDTNRCRKIATATTTLTPCKAGQERNPETNRCRTVKTMPEVNYGVLAAKTTRSASYVWWIVAAIIAGASAYAVWEWHEEIYARFKKIFALVKFRR